MTSQFDFSNDEWEELAAAPLVVGMAIAAAEDSGILGNWRESRTLRDQVSRHAADFPAQSLVAQASTTDTTAQEERFRDAPPEALAVAATETCRSITVVLEAKAEADESREFRQWVYDVGRAVAEAAKEDGVLISAGEAELLATLRSALALPAPG